MSIIKSLQTAAFGVKLRLPPHLNVGHEDDQRAELIDEQTGVAWYLFYFPKLPLDLREQHRADLRRSLEHYARFIFDDAFRRQPPVEGRPPPRTADPSWSPLVDAEHLTVGGAQALRTVHRIAYEPGNEIVMGHLLIPVRQGLFEARTVCIDRMTGVRESVLVEKRIQEQPPSSQEDLNRLLASLKQSDFDDPRHDDAFPSSSLSRTRAALRWLCAGSELRVTEPSPPFKDGEVELRHLGCALVPPPRFVYEAPSDPSQDGSLYRVSFCGTDGVENLQVNRWDKAPRDAASKLPRVAESIAREIHKASGVKDMRVRVDVLPSLGQRARALVIVDGTGTMGALRNAMSFFIDEHKRTWSMDRYGITAVPLDTVIADLDAAVRSFRTVRIAKPAR